jgi:hypothetical protein
MQLPGHCIGAGAAAAAAAAVTALTSLPLSSGWTPWAWAAT